MMSYLGYFAIGQGVNYSRSVSTIFGNADNFQSPDTTVPAIRIAATACKGDEASAMGLWTILRHLLRSYPDIEVYPVYYDLEVPGTLLCAENYMFYSDIKNQLVLTGSLEQGDTVTLNVTLVGSLVESEKRTFAVNAVTVSDIADALPQLAKEITHALLDYSQTLTEQSYAPLSDESLIKSLWELEDVLLSSLYDDSWEQSTFISEALTFIETVDDGLTEKIGAGILHDALLPPFNLDANYVAILSEAALSSAKPVIISSIADALVYSGKSSRVVDLLAERIDQEDRSVQRVFAKAALYSNDYHRAIVCYQDMLSHEPEGQTFLDYAETLRYLLQTERLDSMYRFFLTDTTDATDEILMAYRRANDMQFSIEILQRLLSFENTIEKPLSTDVVELLIQQDNDGTLIQQVLSLLPEDEDIIDIIDALESQADDVVADDHALLALSSLYLAVNDYSAASECLSEVSDKSGKYAKRLSALAKIPDSDLLISDMSQRLSANVMLTNDEIDVLESIIALNDQHEDAYQVLAQAYAARNDVSAACEVLDDAFKATSLQVFIAQKAHILWENEQYTAAVDELLTGLSKYQRDAMLLARLSLYLFEANRPDEARSYLRKAEIADPMSDELRRVRILIGNTLSRE